MEYQTSITDTNKGLERAHGNKTFLFYFYFLHFCLNLKGFFSAELQELQFGCYVLYLKYAFMFSELYFGALWVCRLVVSGPSLWAFKQKSELGVHYCTIRSVFPLD